MKYSLLIQIEGNKIEDLTAACDSVAVKIEKNMLKSSGEDPEGNGRYCYEVRTTPFFTFNNIIDFKAKEDELNNRLKDIETKEKELQDKAEKQTETDNYLTTKEIEIKNKAEEIKNNTPKKPTKFY
jgi:hypothetical protein